MSAEGPPGEGRGPGDGGPVVAVDCNGADLGPGEVAAGAALAAQQGVRVLLFGPAASLGELPPGVEVEDSPVSIAKAPDPVQAARTTPEASIVRAARAVADGRAQALVCAGGHGLGAGGGDLQHQARPGDLPARAGAPAADPRASGDAARRRRQRRRAA